MSETENESVEHLELVVVDNADEYPELNGQDHDEVLGMPDLGGDDEDEEIGDAVAFLNHNGLNHYELPGMPDLGGGDDDEEIGDAEAILNHPGGEPTPDPSDPGDDDSDGDTEGGDFPDPNDQPYDEDNIVWPDWCGECEITCKPHWDHLYVVYQYYKSMFAAQRGTILEQASEIRRLRRDLRDRDELIRRLRFGSRKTEPVSFMTIQPLLPLLTTNQRHIR